MNINNLKEMIRSLIEEIENEEEMDEVSTTGGIAGYNTPKAFGKKSDEKEKAKRMADIVGYTQVNENIKSIIKTLKSGDTIIVKNPDVKGPLYNTPITFLKYNPMWNWLVAKDKSGKTVKVGIENNPDNTPFTIVNEAINIDITNRNLDLLDKAADMAIKNPKGNVVELAKIIKKYVSGIRNSIKESIVNEATNRFQQLRKEEATPNQKIGKGIREMRTQIQEIEKFVEWYSKIKTENDLDSSQYWKRTQKHLNVIRERLNKISQKIQNLSV
jgi:hypothetical protein